MNQMDSEPVSNPTGVREYVRILGYVPNTIGYVCTTKIEKIGGDEGAPIKFFA